MEPSDSASQIAFRTTVFAQLTADSPYTLQWAAISPSKLPLAVGDLDPI